MIFYFSATGNCKYTATKIAEAIKENSISITDCIKNQEFSFEVNDTENIGFVTPTYFWGIPTIVSEFLEKMELQIPDSYHPYIYHIATFGTTTGQASHMVKDLLKRKGLHLDGMFSVQMPDTWTPVFNLTDKAKIAQTNQEAESQIEEVTKKVYLKIAGDFNHRKLPMVAVKLYYPQYEKQRNTKYFTVDNSCITCGLCAKQCPVSAIEIQSRRPVWVKNKCTLCLGCLHRCPKFSIQYGNKTKNHGQYVNPNIKI